MSIPNSAITPLYLVSFFLFAIQYYRSNYDRRLMNLQFGMMAAAILLMFTMVFVPARSFSWLFLLLGLLWLGVAIYFMRKLPPPRT